MAERLEDTYLAEATEQFRHLKRMADKAIAQIPADAFLHAPDAESNSVALIVKHIAGNLRSRWTDFLTTDGEKPDRHRDQEFETTDHDSHEVLLKQWETGWSLVFETMESLAPADLEKTVLIREEPHSVLKAIQRQLTHNAYHVGQIVFLAKQLRSADWKTLTIPRGKTEEFNAKMRERFRGAARAF
jgi:uncharacterized damage-inducible protein DinB